MKNLLQGGFEGAIMPVSPKFKSVCGVLAYKDIPSLPIVPDIAILCTHATRNTQLFTELANKKIPVVIVLSSDMHLIGSSGQTIRMSVQLLRRNIYSTAWS